MKPLSLYIETYGCQMNVNDSERIAAMMADVGYQHSSDLTAADLILLNTCSVRGGAEEKVYNRLSNICALKKKKRELVIGVGGCVAQQEGDELLQRFPKLDLVFGTHTVHLLPQMVVDAQQGVRSSQTEFFDAEQRLDLFPSTDTTGRVSQFVTVMQGCDNFCSYCIVPFVRGREVSRRADDILAEIERLVSSGVKEIVLLGQNVNSYGVQQTGYPTFAELVRQIATIDGLQRIRFTTSHPKDMSDDLIACYADLPKLCGQVQLPAQSGSNAVLERMNRGYTREQYLQRINALKKARPGISITGDVIVGFPGETEADFEDTMDLLREVRYADVYSFAYSPRPGTKAADYAEEISKDEKQRRLAELIALQRKITLEINRSYLGTKQTVLAETVGKNPGQLSGRADSGKTVNFSADSSLLGTMVDLTISAAYQNSLVGEVL